MSERSLVAVIERVTTMAEQILGRTRKMTKSDHDLELELLDKNQVNPTCQCGQFPNKKFEP